MSRTLVDIPANMLTQLTELAKKLDISRAELMRKILSTELQAIEAVLQEHSQQADSPEPEAVPAIAADFCCEPNMGALLVS